MYFTYILYSRTIDKFYVGYSNDLVLRLERHNSGWGKYSSRGIPWQLVYSESYSTKTAAIKRENEIKKKKSRKYIEFLVNGQEGRPE